MVLSNDPLVSFPRKGKFAPPRNPCYRTTSLCGWLPTYKLLHCVRTVCMAFPTTHRPQRLGVESLLCSNATCLHTALNCNAVAFVMVHSVSVCINIVPHLLGWGKRIVTAHRCTSALPDQSVVLS